MKIGRFKAVMMVLTLLVVGGSFVFSGRTGLAFDFAQLNRDAGALVDQGRSAVQSVGDTALKGIQGAPRSVGSFLNSLGEDISRAVPGQEEGRGFYMKIYEETVTKPNKMVDEELSKRFGLKMKLSLQLKAETGQYYFGEFYRSQAGPSQVQYVPELQSSLDLSCSRIRAGMVDQQVKRLQLIEQRLLQKKEKEQAKRAGAADLSSDTQLPVDLSAVNRLIESFPQAKQGFVQQFVQQIPNKPQLETQEVLLGCERDLRDEVDFEVRLQSLLYPARKELEVLQTFYNGKLEEFDGLPKFDLLLDVDVIESIFFGTGVTTGVSTAAGSNAREQQAQEVFRSLVDSSFAELPTGPVRGDKEGKSLFSLIFDPFKNSFLSKLSTQTKTVGFGKKGSQPAGPFCPDTGGLQLDYSTVGKAPEAKSGTAQSSEVIQETEESILARLVRTDPLLESEPEVQEFQKAQPQQTDGRLTVGAASALNVQSACQGNSSFTFGSPILRLVFCLTVEFKKVGKTWERTRDDCISCHIAKMNQIFEEMLLKRSVRPHKNTGTIMESAICEDGYGNDVGFFSFIEWVPVKLYPDICYPQAGVTKEDTGRLSGYPELVSKVDKPGLVLECVDFEDQDARDRCKKALIFSGRLSYEEYRLAYLTRDDLWKRLVGEKGQAEREQHEFLYRLGKDQPVFGEEEKLQQDLKKRKDCLAQRISLVQSSQDLEVSGSVDQKSAEVLKIKGFFEGDPAPGLVPQGCDSTDTVDRFERDLFAERTRVANLVNRYNQMNRDFFQGRSCGPFATPSLYSQLEQFVSDRVFNTNYYLDTSFRATQSPAERATPQIASNTNITDVNELLNEVGKAVQAGEKQFETSSIQASFESDQNKAMILQKALGPELLNFRTIMRSFTDWWAEMVDKKQFLDPSGKRINALESFLNKAK